MEHCVGQSSFVVSGQRHGDYSMSRCWSCILSWQQCMFGMRLGQTSVCFFHGQALVPIINNQTSHEPYIMALLSPLVLVCLRLY